MFGTDYRYPDGTCIRDYVHVSDLAEAHVSGAAAAARRWGELGSEPRDRAGLLRTRGNRYGAA